MAFRLKCPCSWTEEVDNLQDARQSLQHGWGCSAHRGQGVIEEFVPAVTTTTPERIVAVHPAVEPTRFEVQYKWPGTGWRDIGTPSLKNHTSVAAAQAALLKTGWESLQTDRATYRILETPANRVHPAFAPPDDVEVEIRVRVPRKTWRGEKSSFQVLYNIPAHSEYDEAEVLSFKEVTQ